MLHPELSPEQKARRQSWDASRKAAWRVANVEHRIWRHCPSCGTSYGGHELLPGQPPGICPMCFTEEAESAG